MILSPAPVSTDRFSFNLNDRVFTAELSDLGRDFRFGRVYDDACDVGLTLVSTRTGRRVVFAIENEIRDREGELQYIELRPASRFESDDLPAVRLFND